MGEFKQHLYHLQLKKGNLQIIGDTFFWIKQWGFNIVVAGNIIFIVLPLQEKRLMKVFGGRIVFVMGSF
jgi:hypothetical protein